MTEPCAAIVLAAGSSSRLGQPKQLLCVAGETLLRRTACLALNCGATPVIVILGAEILACRAALAGLAVETRENRKAAEGMGSSLRVGMAALARLQPSTARVLLLVCDQPLIQLEHLQALLRADSPAGAAAAEYDSRLGVPAVFERRHFAALAASHGDQGARALLREIGAVGVPMPEACVDLDTAQDLAAFSER